jgi:hypothetical protein
MIGSAMVTMATKLFCLNKLLEKSALLPCCFCRLSYLLKDLILQFLDILLIISPNYVN